MMQWLRGAHELLQALNRLVSVVRQSHLDLASRQDPRLKFPRDIRDFLMPRRSLGDTVCAPISNWDLFTTKENMSTGKYTFVVEHLDSELGPWSALEYKTIARESKQSGCHFILSSVPQSLLESQSLKDLQVSGAEARNDSIETYLASKKERICLLDPAAKEELEPSAAAKFDVFLFGGILGT